MDYERMTKGELIEALLASDERWRSISESTMDHLLLIDRDARILSINRTRPELTQEEVVGSFVYDHVHEQFRPAMKACVEGVLRTGKPDVHEVVGIRRLVRQMRNPELPELREVHGVQGGQPRSAKHRNRDSDEERDDTEHDENLDEREAVSSLRQHTVGTGISSGWNHLGPPTAENRLLRFYDFLMTTECQHLLAIKCHFGSAHDANRPEASKMGESRHDEPQEHQAA